MASKRKEVVRRGLTTGLSSRSASPQPPPAAAAVGSRHLFTTLTVAPTSRLNPFERRASALEVTSSKNSVRSCRGTGQIPDCESCAACAESSLSNSDKASKMAMARDPAQHVITSDRHVRSSHREVQRGLGAEQPRHCVAEQFVQVRWTSLTGSLLVSVGCLIPIVVLGNEMKTR